MSSGTLQRLSGIAGILGGLTLFAGDMLFYFSTQSDNVTLNMAHSSDWRITASAFTALIATWLYLLGLYSVYYAFRPATAKARWTVVLTFGALLVNFGIVHAQYVAIATSAKLALQNGLDIMQSAAFARHINDLLRLPGYLFFAVLSVVFLVNVWKGKTLYKKIMVLFFPLIPYIFLFVLKPALHGTAYVVVIGGYLNLLLVIFFTASTVMLWNKE